MSNDNNMGQFMQMLAMLQAMRSAMGTPESSISASEDIGARAGAARGAALNLLLALTGILAGLALHFAGWVWAIGLDVDLRQAIIGGAVYLLLLVLPAGMLQARLGWPFVRGYLWTLALTWALAFLLLVALAEFETTWGVAVAFVGVAVGAASMPFAYNQWKDLTVPYWRESPHEKAIQQQLFPAIGDMMLSGGGQGETVRTVLEVRTENGEYVTDTDVLELSVDAALRFADELVRAGWDLKEARWGAFHEVFASYPAYRNTRAAMERSGLVRKSNPGASNSTFEMTPRGRAVMRRLANEYQERRNGS